MDEDDVPLLPVLAVWTVCSKVLWGKRMQETQVGVSEIVFIVLWKKKKCGHLLVKCLCGDFGDFFDLDHLSSG